jgi:mannose-6-phosphate isomerase-like protein (cupin superfamily)
VFGKTETFLVTEGEVRLEVIDNSIRIEWKTAKTPGDVILKTGESFTIRPFLVHRFSSATPGVAKVIEFSTQHFEEDSYRLEESGPVPPEVV